MEYTLDDVVRALQRKLPSGTPALHAARLIYDWETDTIAYDTARRDSWFRFGVQSPEETIRRRAGVCTDMTLLYCTIARRLGLRAHYADVTVDHRSRNVDHVCALVELPPRRLLADVAYKQFDIAHKAYSIIEEETLTEPLPDEPAREPQHLPYRPRTLGVPETAAACALLLGAAYFFTHLPVTARPQERPEAHPRKYPAEPRPHRQRHY